MLLQGASIVRLANKVVRAENKDFVLVAIYVGDDAKADRHVLYQEPQSNQVCRRTARVFNQQSPPQVYYEEQAFNFTKQHDRAQFALELYNLSSRLRGAADDKDTKGKMNKFKTVVDDNKQRFHIKSLFTKPDKRKRPPTDEGDQTRHPSSASGAAQELQEHGYQVVTNSFEDEAGTWELLIQVQTFVFQL